jgi:hypothetical protein
MDKEIRIHVAIGGLVIAHPQILSRLFATFPPLSALMGARNALIPYRVCRERRGTRGAIIG